MILPKERDPRLVTIRRGGTLTDEDHRLLALWAATCAEHVLPLFEAVRPDDRRPREAIDRIRAWTRGEIRMMQARAAGGHAMGAARDLSGAPRNAAYAAGQAAVVAHVAAHDLGAAAYAIKAVRAAAPKARPTRRGAASAAGSVTSCRRRSASSCSTTSGCGTTSAGRCSTAELVLGSAGGSAVGRCRRHGIGGRLLGRGEHRPVAALGLRRVQRAVGLVDQAVRGAGVLEQVGDAEAGGDLAVQAGEADAGDGGADASRPPAGPPSWSCRGAGRGTPRPRTGRRSRSRAGSP